VIDVRSTAQVEITASSGSIDQRNFADDHWLSISGRIEQLVNPIAPATPASPAPSSPSL
jgi:hypothetical protein